MRQRKIPHQLELQQARERLDERIAYYSGKYGLPGQWQGNTWKGKRRGFRLELTLEADAVEILLDKTWLIPVPEEKLLGKIADGLAARLSE